jgi:hypothetical protein
MKSTVKDKYEKDPARFFLFEGQLASCNHCSRKKKAHKWRIGGRVRKHQSYVLVRAGSKFKSPFRKRTSIDKKTKTVKRPL